jgi:ribosomal protein L37AE/L43A
MNAENRSFGVGGEVSLETGLPKAAFEIADSSLKSMEGDGQPPRTSSLGVIVPAGDRRKGKVPGFLSIKEHTCPRCGRREYANLRQGDLVLCSICLMNKTSRAERRGLQSPWKHPDRHRARSPKPSNSRSRFKTIPPAWVCEKCGASFRGRSNSQRFCGQCQEKNSILKNRERQARFRERGKEVSE